MVGSHAEASTLDGVQLALAGWFQIILAFWLFTKPGKLPLVLNLVVNLGLIGAWAVSRSAGLPWGAPAGVAEDVGRVDLLCVGAEVALVVLSAAPLCRPQLAFTARGPLVGVMAAVPLIAVKGLTTAALASGEAAEHGGAAHAHGEEAAAGRDDGHAHGAAPAGGESAFAALAADEVCDSDVNVASDYTELSALGDDHHGDGSTDGGHSHGAAADETLYDGDQPDSRMIGISYATFSNEVIDPADHGFTGPSDYPHNHDGLCTHGGLVVGSSISDEACARRGGSKIGAALQMIHAWVVPGCESPMTSSAPRTPSWTGPSASTPRSRDRPTAPAPATTSTPPPACRPTSSTPEPSGSGTETEATTGPWGAAAGRPGRSRPHPFRVCAGRGHSFALIGARSLTKLVRAGVPPTVRSSTPGPRGCHRFCPSRRAERAQKGSGPEGS